MKNKILIIVGFLLIASGIFNLGLEEGRRTANSFFDKGKYEGYKIGCKLTRDAIDGQKKENEEAAKHGVQFISNEEYWKRMMSLSMTDPEFYQKLIQEQLEQYDDGFELGKEFMRQEFSGKNIELKKELHSQ
jgi:hypothetical protein